MPEDIKNKIQLTEDTLENIKLMAPLLDEESQNRIFWLMLGIYKGTESNKRADN